MTKEELIALLADPDVGAAIKALSAPAPEVEVEMPSAMPCAPMAPSAPPAAPMPMTPEQMVAAARAAVREEIATLLPRRGAVSEAVAAASKVGGGVGAPAPKSRIDTAREIAKNEGISLVDSLKRVARNANGV